MGIQGVRCEERNVDVRAELEGAACSEDPLSFCRGLRKSLVGVASALLVTAVLVSPSTINCPKAFAQELARSRPASFQTHTPKASSDVDTGSVLGKVKLLCFYEVKDGNLRQCIIPRGSIEQGVPIKVDGYVCGIVAFCAQDMGISVDGQEMSKIRKNGDGTFSLQRFGTMKPEDFSIVRSDRAYYGELTEKGHGEAFLKSGYSFFPEVVGDTIATRNHFQITLDVDGKSITLPVEQQGYVQVQDLPLMSSNPNGEDLAFRYLGTRLAALQQEAPDFSARLQAIAAGVNNVKRILGADLIRDVNIVDYGDVYNAVTSNSGNEMWVYATAFRKEPVAELKTIAEHETLHRFSSRIGFTSDSELRELFSDLRGFGEYSYERFLTVATGQTPMERAGDQNFKHSLFFSFINEKNFLDKMKGGHSQQNIDEYCASFVHSLMYVDRLESNLNRAIQCGPSERSRHLTTAEKTLVLDDYIKTVQAMRDSIADAGRSQGVPTDHIAAVLKYAYDEATHIRARLQTVNLASAQGEGIGPDAQVLAH